MITTYGSRSTGINVYAGAVAVHGVQSANATVIVNNSGSVITSGSRAPAIRAEIFGDSSITITNAAGGVLKSTGRPFTVISLDTDGGLQSVVNNTITNASPSGVLAGGLIQGNIRSFGVANDTFFNNAGATWIMQGDSNFGKGTDVVSNSGTVSMLNSKHDLAAAGAGHYKYGPLVVNTCVTCGHDGWNGQQQQQQQQQYAGGGNVLTDSGSSGSSGGWSNSHWHNNSQYLFHTIFLNGLETFVNNPTGLVTMVDGFANQQIVVSGNFVGNGGTVAVDAYLGGSFNCITCVDKSKSAKDIAQQQQQQQQQQIVVNVTVNGYNSYPDSLEWVVRFLRLVRLLG